MLPCMIDDDCECTDRFIYPADNATAFGREKLYEEVHTSSNGVRVFRFILGRIVRKHLYV